MNATPGCLFLTYIIYFVQNYKNVFINKLYFTKNYLFIIFIRLKVEIYDIYLTAVKKNAQNTLQQYKFKINLSVYNILKICVQIR